MADSPSLPGARPQATRKRAGILKAARDLFLTDGYERTSVDAVSARAGVSKRTVYDYFGDKEAVFRAVVQIEAEALTASIQAAVDEELGGEAELSAALLAFARRIATQTLSSSHYAVLRRLLSTEASRFPDLLARSSVEGPELLLAERFAAYATTGQLVTDKPYRAAQHFSALTFLLALDAVTPHAWEPPDAERVDEILVDGVHAFIRAYRRPP